jgi:DNA-binding PadR family transcriptional regulator
MAKGDYLGEFELIVMLAVLRLKDDAYGKRIWDEIEKRTGRSVIIAAVYAALERLERKGYVSSWVGDPTPVRGGRAKRYFVIEDAGLAAVRQSREMFVSMFSGLKPVLRDI